MYAGMELEKDPCVEMEARKQFGQTLFFYTGLDMQCHQRIQADTKHGFRGTKGGVEGADTKLNSSDVSQCLDLAGVVPFFLVWGLVDVDAPAFGGLEGRACWDGLLCAGCCARA